MIINELKLAPTKSMGCEKEVLKITSESKRNEGIKKITQ
jgi:hypothetical protein